MATLYKNGPQTLTNLVCFEGAASAGGDGVTAECVSVLQPPKAHPCQDLISRTALLCVHSEGLCLHQLLLCSIPQTSHPQDFKFKDPTVKEIICPICDSTTAVIHHVSTGRKNEDGFTENPFSLQSGLSPAPLGLLISFFYHEGIFWVPPPQCLPTGCQPCSHLAASMCSDSSGRGARAFPTGTACSREVIVLISPSDGDVGGQLHPPFTSAPGSVSASVSSIRAHMFPVSLQGELHISGGMPSHLSFQSPTMPVKLFMGR